MRWNKLKRMAFDHPYFEYKKHLLSEAEAERILSTGYIGVDEFMQNVRVRCEQSETIPAYGETGIPQSTRKHHHVRGPFVRRLVIACIALLFAFIFLTFTEPGIALANSIRAFIVQIFDGSLTTQSIEPPKGLSPIDFENIPDTFSSLEEATMIIGRPVVDASGTSRNLLSIRVRMIANLSVDIQTEYRTNVGDTYYVVQSFYADDTTWGTYGSAADMEVIQTTLPNGAVMFIGRHDDGTAFGESFYPGTRISILSIKLTPEELLNIVDKICFIEP